MRRAMALALALISGVAPLAAQARAYSTHGDPTLANLVAEALQRNPAIRAAEWQEAAVREGDCRRHDIAGSGAATHGIPARLRDAGRSADRRHSRHAADALVRQAGGRGQSRDPASRGARRARPRPARQCHPAGEARALRGGVRRKGHSDRRRRSGVAAPLRVVGACPIRPGHGLAARCPADSGRNHPGSRSAAGARGGSATASRRT